MNDREKLAADLLAVERFIQAHTGRDAALVAYAKKWLDELDRAALRITRPSAPTPRRT